MPTYEYQCDACEHNFDEFQSIKAEALTKCPKCKKKKLRRVFGAGAAILFKGSGFYQTDYRSESYQAAAKKDQEASQPPADKKGSAPAKPGADKAPAAATSAGATGKGK